MKLFLILLSSLFFTLYANLPKEFDVIAIPEKNDRITLSAAAVELAKGIGDVEFDEAFIKRIQEAEKGKETGEFIERWENGQIKMRGSFKKGLAEGHLHGWYANGWEAFKGFYKDGRRIGVHMTFFPIRMCKYENSYARIWNYDDDGVLDGIQLANHPLTLNLHAYVPYTNGLPDGIASIYAEKGGALLEIVYKMGKEEVKKK